MSKSQEDMEKIMMIVLKAADGAEQNAAYGGRMDDGGAHVLRTQVEFYKMGMNLMMPAQWKEYEKTMDPEYKEYLRLVEKFGR